MYNYRELNVLDYTLHLARRASATVIDDSKKSWLLYLQVIEDLLGPTNDEPEEQIPISAYEAANLPIHTQSEFGCAAE